MITEKSTLECGIEFPEGSGTFHYDFEIRLATVGDNIAVYEDPDIIGGGVSQMRVTAGNLARCLLSLGTIPEKDITSDLISNAVDTDYDILLGAWESLRKKRKRPSESMQTSVSPGSSSANTESPTIDSTLLPDPS